MASFKYFGLLLVAFCVHTSGASRLKSMANGNRLYDCLMNELCKCRSIRDYEECWEKLEDRTKLWLVEQVNKCNISKVEIKTFGEMVDQICSFPEEPWKKCYQKANEDVKVYMRKRNEVNTAEAKKECASIELARVCLAPNLSKCSSYGMTCF